MPEAYTSVFSIKTETFEGPLELLIELVEKRKLLINSISLAAVTDEYMATVSDMQEQSLPHTAQFITLAATLLLIKSKSLLPVLDLTDEEEASIEDLNERLKQYQIFRTIAAVLQLSYGKQVMHEPEYTPPRTTLFIPDSFTTIPSLRDAMERVITNLPKATPEKPTAQVRPTITLEEMMDTLKRRIEHQMKLSFFDIKRREPERKNVIVGFLAILELFKQGDVLVSQMTRFADIELELERSDIPRYY